MVWVPAPASGDVTLDEALMMASPDGATTVAARRTQRDACRCAGPVDVPSVRKFRVGSGAMEEGGDARCGRGREACTGTHS